jgi:hypothetical protein
MTSEISNGGNDRYNRHNSLIYLIFESGTFTYTNDFRCIIEGQLWPREMKAAWDIVGIYKEQHKQSNRGVKS